MTDIAAEIRRLGQSYQRPDNYGDGDLMLKAAAEIERLTARNAEHEAIRFGVMAQVKGVNDINAALEKQIEHLRTTLTTVWLFIEDEMIAHAVVVLEGRDARDPSNPSLLKLIDVALGDCEQYARKE